MNSLELLGFCGTGILSVQLCPQIHKVIKTRSAKDISYTMMGANITGVTAVIIYSIGKGSPELYLPLLLSVTNSIILLSLKTYFQRTEESFIPSVM